ncbi:MAG: succinyl-diaminopimelate desuccinylase [Wenzhouxiangellaceae bacterium]
MAGLELSDAVVKLTAELIRRPSITPEDAGCQTLIAGRLARAGMQIEHFAFGRVSNLLATHGSGQPHLLLLGHTDVVPPGPESEWRSPPFEPVLRSGRLYGRGAADMKGAVAAFTLACEAFVSQWPKHPGRLSLLLTSDEEGPAEDGVRRVVPELQRRGWLPDHVLVGEPSSAERLGDVIRVGRRGSIHGVLEVSGQQGHTAYASPGQNPVHAAAPLLAELTALRFDDGDAHFPPTVLQVSNLHAGTGANNVTPGVLQVRFNLRNNPNSSAETLRRRVQALVDRHCPGRARLQWRVSGEPFGPASGALLDAVQAELAARFGVGAVADTGGGTSDGRFFGPLGIEVVELGPVNRSIHRIDEHVAVEDLQRLPGIYLGVIGRLLGTDTR